MVKVTTEQLKEITHISGGYKAISDNSGLSVPDIKAKMNGYAVANDLFIERVLNAARNLGAVNKIAALNRAMRRFEREAGIKNGR